MKAQVKWQLLLTMVLASALTACGGGSSSGTSSPTAATPTGNGTILTSTASPSSVNQIIDYYGDSTVWGFSSGTAGTQVAVLPTDTFRSLLPAQARYIVRNQGVSRTTACQLLNGTDGRHPAWTEEMANSDAKFVFINHAINDQRDDIGESVANYRNCLTSLVRGARQRGKIVILETPNPTDQTNAGLDEYVNGMRAVAAAEGVPVIDQYQYLLGVLGGRDVRTLMPDGIHPSDETYALKGRFAATEFLKMSF